MCLTSCFLSRKAQHNLTFSNLTVENGLSQNSVMSTAQDSTGLIWFGTRQGINRYDGYHFKNYSNTDKKVDAQQEVTSLLTDYKGMLWAGTNAGLKQYNLKKDSFEKTKDLSNELIELLFQGKDKKLWVGTHKGLKLLVNREEQKFKTFLFNPKLDDPSNSVYAMCEDKTGHIWVGTGGGLILMSYQKGTFRFKKINFLTNPKAGYITAIAKDKHQNTWIGTSNGLYVLNNKAELSKTFLHTEGNPMSLVHNDIRELMLNENGTMWIGTQNGLSIFNPSTGLFTNHQHNPESIGSISHNSIHHLF